MRGECRRRLVARFLAAPVAAVALPAAAARAPQPVPPAVMPAAAARAARPVAQCPDPTILVEKSASRAVTLVCTGGGLPMRSASTIQRLSDVRPRSAFASGGSPRWAIGDFWGPDLERVGARYLLYYSVKRGGDGRHCIGVAVSTRPGGGFQDLGAPLIDDERDGAIDPALLSVRGQLFLFYKRDGNSVGAPSVIFGRRLSANGLRAVGPKIALIHSRAGGREHGIVEGPAPIHLGDTTYLLYSEGKFFTPGYAEGEATLTGYPLGPYRSVGGPPVLHGSGKWVGTGGASIVVDGDRLLLAYAAFHPGGRPLRRLLFIRALRLEDGILRPFGPARLIWLRGA